jgi:hypothetical protein
MTIFRQEFIGGRGASLMTDEYTTREVPVTALGEDAE